MKEFIKKGVESCLFQAHQSAHFSLAAGGRGGGEIARQTRLSVPSLSPNITDLMKSNYSRVSEGKTVTETSFITEKQEPVIEEYGYH